MISGVPSTNTESENPFASIVTADAVKCILAKQVEKAKEGNTASANLILKIAAASAGISSGQRTNPKTPVASRPSVPLLVNLIRRTGPITVDQLSARLGNDPAVIRGVLENSDRFTLNSRGVWSVDATPAIGEG